MKRIIRDRLLTPEESTKYNAIREEIEQEQPEISDRIRKKMAEKKQAEADESPEATPVERGADNLEAVAKTLGVAVNQLAASTVLVLPENIWTAESPDELYDADDLVFLAKTLKSKGVSCKTAYDFGARPKVMNRRGADVWLGVIWLFLENGGFPLAVNVMSDWLKNKFLANKPRMESSVADEPSTIHIELRVQRKKRASTLKFTGPASDLVAVLASLKELGKDDK